LLAIAALRNLPRKVVYTRRRFAYAVVADGGLIAMLLSSNNENAGARLMTREIA